MSTDVFAGTSHYYALYRHDYPVEVIDCIREKLGLDGSGRLLDVGCGTGKLTIPLARYFREAVGIDISQDMIVEAQLQSAGAAQANIRWLVGDAHVVPLSLGKFDVISCGDAFHWMERERALQSWYDALNPSGGIALTGAGGGSGQGPLPWQQAMWDVIHRWLGPERRNSSWQRRITRDHAEVLSDLPFAWVETYEFPLQHTRDVESIIGFLYSTSFCNRELLGDNRQAFEEDLRATLLGVEPTGLFVEPVKAQCILAKKHD